MLRRSLREHAERSAELRRVREEMRNWNLLRRWSMRDAPVRSDVHGRGGVLRNLVLHDGADLLRSSRPAGPRSCMHDSERWDVSDGLRSALHLCVS